MAAEQEAAERHDITDILSSGRERERGEGKRVAGGEGNVTRGGRCLTFIQGVVRVAALQLPQPQAKLTCRETLLDRVTTTTTTTTRGQQGSVMPAGSCSFIAFVSPLQSVLEC